MQHVCKTFSFTHLPSAGLAVPLPAETAAAQFAILQPALLPLLHAWLNPKGSRGWHNDDGAIANAEALCAVLSLYRFLLLRESALGSNLTGGKTGRGIYWRAVHTCEIVADYACPTPPA